MRKHSDLPVIRGLSQHLGTHGTVLNVYSLPPCPACATAEKRWEAPYFWALLLSDQFQDLGLKLGTVQVHFQHPPSSKPGKGAPRLSAHLSEMPPGWF